MAQGISAAAPSGTQRGYVYPTDHYWALEDGKSVARCLHQKRGDFFQFLTDSGLQEKIRRSWNYFYGNWNALPSAPGEMAIKMDNRTGNVHLGINEFRALVSQLAILVTENPPAWDTIARNSSHRALQQTIIGNDLLDYEMEGPHNVEERLRDSVEDALIFTAGYVWTRWEEGYGKEIGADLEGNIAYEGDLCHSTPNYYQVLWPWDRPWRDKEWICVWKDENLWDLCARYPKQREELLAARDSKPQYGPDGFKQIGARPPNCDTVECGYFYHLKKPALPYGRRITFAGEVVLEDTYKDPGNVMGGYGEEAGGIGVAGAALVWENLDQPEPEGWDQMLPVSRVIPSRFLLSSLGYSIAFDLQAFNEALNGEISTILNNHKNFGMLRVWVNIADEINHEPLDEGSVLVKSQTQPVTLDLAKPLPEGFEMIQTLRALGEAVSGVNAVSRGIPSDKASSGVALALVDQKAQQAASAFIASYYQHLCDVGSITLENYQHHALEPRTLAATSGSNRTAIKEFSSGDLDLIDRVAVKAGNPLSRTLSGRFELAKFLAENDLVKNKEELITVLETGQYKPLLRAESAELAIVHDENERLFRGEPVRVSPLDNHVLHIREHHASMDSTELREDGTIGLGITTHIQQHIEMLRVPKIAEMQLILGYEVPQFLMQSAAPEGAPLPPGGDGGAGGPAPPGGGGGPPKPLPPGLAAALEPEGNAPGTQPHIPPKPPRIGEGPRSGIQEALADAALKAGVLR